MARTKKRKAISQDIPDDAWEQRRRFLMDFLGARPRRTGEGGADEAAEAGEDKLLPLPPDMTPAPDALSKIRDKLNLPDSQNTVGAARSSVPGLEDIGFFGISATLRRKAKQPTLDELYGKDRPIKSPNPNPMASAHAEEDMLSAVHVALEKLGLDDDALEGHVVDILISNAGGICPTCTGGLTTQNYQDGVLKQFSDIYPTLTLRITAQGGDALTLTQKIDGKTVDMSRNVVLIRGGVLVDG